MAGKSEHGLGAHDGPSDKDASGHMGVSQEQVGSGKENDPNNFANDRDRAAAAGRKGGHESHKRD
jgi:general stress protein YciG